MLIYFGMILLKYFILFWIDEYETLDVEDGNGNGNNEMIRTRNGSSTSDIEYRSSSTTPAIDSQGKSYINLIRVDSKERNN